MVANPARGLLSRANEFFLSTFAPENLVSRDGFGRHVPRMILCLSRGCGSEPLPEDKKLTTVE